MQRYPDWDPRSWSEPFRDPPTVPRRPAVPGQWVPDSSSASGYRWDRGAPAADNSLTLLGASAVTPAHEWGTPRKEPAMTELEPEPQPVEATGYNPYASFQDSAEEVAENPHLPQSMGGLDGTQLAICPNCGTGVAASRLKQQG